jgi:hypothetical protein
MKILLIKFCIMTSVLMLSSHASAQYPPAPGQPGTTAIFQDSSVIYAWAKHCEVIRGFVNISDTNYVYNNSNHTTYGNIYMATDKADALVISLGDGGMATLTFDTIIADHAGWDFAVFENSFSNGFLELAFVEVSSDGAHFVRFPSTSLTPQGPQVGTFDTTDTRLINNLAGKYRLEYGTPFDLYQLRDSSALDISHITHIRIVDVVGCIQDVFATFDASHHKINDPWPTPFDTGGFDLDAVALVRNAPTSSGEGNESGSLRIYPNPCRDQAVISAPGKGSYDLVLMGNDGRQIHSTRFSSRVTLDLTDLSPGCYFVSVSLTGSTERTVKKLLKY